MRPGRAVSLTPSRVDLLPILNPPALRGRKLTRPTPGIEAVFHPFVLSGRRPIIPRQTHKRCTHCQEWLPFSAFWNELERHILDGQAQPNEYLLPRRSLRPNRHKPGEKFVTEYRDEPMGVHGLHKWWYACLARAGVVAKGQTRGERMHKARHTAGQRVLDASGNLKAVQKLLGHSSISTTGDI